MHSLQAPIVVEGALVDVLVGLADVDAIALRKAGSPVPAPQAVRALIDIGADISCIDTALLAPVVGAGVKPRRLVFSSLTPSGSLTICPEYFVGLSIVHPSGNRRMNLVLRNLPVLEQALDRFTCKVILGRDVLARCLLVYDGAGGQFTLAY